VLVNLNSEKMKLIWYKAKRELLFQLKKLDSWFRIVKTKSKISRAYRRKSFFPKWLNRITVTTSIILLLITTLVVILAVKDNFKIDIKHLAVAKISIEDSLKIKVKNDSLDQLDRELTMLAPFPAFPDQKEMKYIIVADKFNRVLYLLKSSDRIWAIVRTFPIAIGAKEGKKVIRGDKRTPEGLYFIVGRKEEIDLNEVYGPLAFVLNYPNKKDLEAGRTGSGIWIHGTLPGEVPVDTKGCIELHNMNLVKLSNILGRGELVPVIILNEPFFDLSEIVNLPDIWAERDEIKNGDERRMSEVFSFVSQWRKDWESGDLGRYSQSYDTLNFRGGKYKWAGWKDKKNRIFKIYKEIVVEVSDSVITSLTDSTATVEFNQKYRSDYFKAYNGKRLSLKKIGPNWKIVGEISIPLKEKL
jgi:murein L,D-transpeptidase YafK